MRRVVGLACGWMLLPLLVGGCGEAPTPYLEVKRIDEPFSAEELRAYLAVVARLPQGKVPALPSQFVPPPLWTASRTRPISELLAEEQRMIDDRWSVARLAQSLDRNRTLRKELAAANMTLEQFLGFTLALGIALAHESLPEETDLPSLRARGDDALELLRRDHRPFSELSDDDAHQVLQHAGWISLTDRVQRLLVVPEANRRLAREHRAALEAALPTQFLRDPLTGFAQRMSENGVPFEELSESGSDASLTWDPAGSLLGSAEEGVDLPRGRQPNGAEAGIESEIPTVAP